MAYYFHVIILGLQNISGMLVQQPEPNTLPDTQLHHSTTSQVKADQKAGLMEQGLERWQYAGVIFRTTCFFLKSLFH